MSKSLVYNTTLFLSFLFSSILTSQNNFNIDLVSQVEIEVKSNDIWGYVDQNGIEYAILGTIEDTRIYSLENPSSPILRFTQDGADGIWRDIKSFGNICYKSNKLVNILNV